jgi:hypothetical protein
MRDGGPDASIYSLSERKIRRAAAVLQLALLCARDGLDWDGTLERIHDALYVATREAAGRETSPTTAIIDSQSAKAAQKGALRSTRRASMRARRSRAASVISLSTRSASCSA